ncbi:16S rRNA (guanine(966)-N(2))-methyltransferase RsmD [Aestuariibius insulae]|uniref:16S rRNA (guanine(966)-N(2))-methyltransferase RsmD n=1 Tax=Aestuariibius insulae TaxID=2058287 RepID=UPI00345EDA3A
MRIVAGRHKGLRLTPVGKGDPAAHLRPTTDRIRESLFNILHTRGLPGPETRVLDLFAGTGALGLEALSRGAAHVTFVEKNRPAQRLIEANIAKAGRAEDTRLLKTDATRLPMADHSFDLVFLDPPYGTDLGGKALAAAPWIAEGALIVWEDDRAHPAPEGFIPADERRFGSTWITFLEKPAAPR